MWRGSGVTEYPAIERTDYTEETTWSMNGKDPVIHFEQKTWKEAGIPVFWESGFLIDRDDKIEMISAQKSGRVEILAGPLRQTSPDTYEILLESVHIINDQRVVGSRRHFWLTPEKITYELDMKTHSHDSYAAHLKGTIRRVQS